MRQLDNTIRKAFNLEPILTTAATTSVATSTPSCRSTIFEDCHLQQQNNLVHAEWYFHLPVAGQGMTSVDLRRLLREYDMSQLSNKADSLLASFSSEVNRVKQRVATSSRARREEDLLAYVNLIYVLNRVFENNATPYSYVVPSGACDDLENEPYYTIQSDRFLFEYLNSLLALLGHYNNEAVTIGLEREKTTDKEKKREMMLTEARLFHMCTEVLSVVLEQCRAPREPYKLIYKEQPRSLGVDPRTGEIISGGEQSSSNLPLKEFICAFLGGETSVEARRHLCTAKKCEVLYMLSRESTEGTNDVALMGNIYNAYKKAFELAGEANYALANHCRFMAHLWFLRTHLYVVKQSSDNLLYALTRREETYSERELSKEILARLLYVTEEAKRMAEKMNGIGLCADLEEMYNTLVAELADLTASFDKELYKTRQMKEAKGLDFSLVPDATQMSETTNHFGDARKLSQQQYLEKQPEISQCQQLLRALYEKLTQEQSESLKKKNNTNQTTQQQSVSIAPMERPLKRGHFTEREWWLNYMIKSYSKKENAFLIDSALYNDFVAELEEVKEAIKQVC